MYRHLASGFSGAARPVTGPPVLTPEDIDWDRQREAKAFARLRHLLLVADMALGGALALGLLVSGLSIQLRQWVESFTTQPVLVVGGFFLVLSIGYALLMLPLEYWRGFRLPHRFGLSNETLRAWFADQVKAGLVGLGLGLVVIEVIYYLLRVVPVWWWLVTAGFLLLLTVVVANLAPVLLVPLFYKLKPLADEELVARLERLAERANTRVRGVFTIDLSSKTKAANAMVMGLGNTRRIVLGDTLHDDYGAEEIEVILAHELGHHTRRDLWWGMLLQSALTLIGLWVTHIVLSWGVRVMGLAGVDDVAGMPLLALVLAEFMAVTTPLSNAFSRWREREADDYALRITRKPEAFVSVMVRLANQNLGDVDPEPWVELLLHSHPPLGKRIRRGGRLLQEEREALSSRA